MEPVHQRLQGVILVDESRSQRTGSFPFHPITFEAAKCLVPVGNVALLEYGIEFLASNDVEDIYILCSHNPDEVEEYVRSSSWTDVRGLSVSVVKISAGICENAGDALRHLDTMGVIQSNPFILISGDLVSNMNLKSAILNHKESAKKDRRVMTCVFQECGPFWRSRSLEDDIVVVLDRASGQLLGYDNDREEDFVAMDIKAFKERQGSSIGFRYDLVDCFIDICDPDVLKLFSENFDYQHRRKDLLLGVLGSGEMFNHTVFSHIVQGEYAARVKDLRTYGSVSKDLIQRCIYPICPDNNMLSSTNYTFMRNNIYKESGVLMSRSSSVYRNTIIGSRTSIGENTVISDCVIGRDCVIGDNVTLSGSYVWDGCKIATDCTVTKSILCNKVELSRGSQIGEGCVLSYQVKIGSHHILLPHTLVTCDSALSDDGFSDTGSIVGKEDEEGVSWRPQDVGTEGEGRIFYQVKGDIVMNSVAPTAQHVVHQFDVQKGEGDTLSEDGNFDNHKQNFEDEVVDTLQRGETEGLEVENTVLEILALKLSHNVEDIHEYSKAIFRALFSCISPQLSVNKLKKGDEEKLVSIFRKWSRLLEKFSKNDGAQISVLSAVEDICVDHSEFTRLFCGSVQILYELEIIEEERILEYWEAQAASPSEVVRSLGDFVEWLRTAESESD